jgi:CBS domain containing-hemolysin-like protein
LAWIIFPVLILTRFASSVAELGAEEAAAKPASTPSEDIEVLLDAGQEEGLIGEDDRKLIQSVVEFGDKTVREVMTPRPQIVAIEASQSVEQLRELLISSQFSRIPVYENSIDHVVGFLHSRDALEMEEAKRAQTKVRELVRPIPLVPESKPIHVLLREMQESNIHMAVVVDEYGQTAGLATLEDLMEEIVGEIRDESEPDMDVVEQPDHSFVASGNLDLDRLEELVGFRPAEEFETTTVGGLVCEHLGQVPNPGATVRLDGIEIEVLSADERRVNSVRFRRVEPKESANEKEPVAQEDDRHSAEGAA